MIKLLLQVQSAADCDRDELDELTQQLKSELLETSVDSIEPVISPEQPVGTRVGDPMTVGQLLITLGAAGGVLTTFVGAIRDWALRGEKRSVTIEMNGDKLTVTELSEDNQQSLINAWIVRHGGG